MYGQHLNEASCEYELVAAIKDCPGTNKVRAWGMILELSLPCQQVAPDARNVVATR